ILWLSVENVPIFTAVLIVLPTVWANTEKGILSVDKDLIQMGKAFGLSRSEVFIRIKLPSVKPYFVAALNSAVGMAWKAGIAAEVICPYKDSIGSALHESKITFETVDTFSWTAAVVERRSAPFSFAKIGFSFANTTAANASATRPRTRRRSR
ncbi:MAG: ABC transporter permease subunit, partial [Thermoguttaceae bacterium]|nr:ABC transporter permease subunit [Thermoguttaceae bacterium]